MITAVEQFAGFRKARRTASAARDYWQSREATIGSKIIVIILQVERVIEHWRWDDSILGLP